MGIKYQWKLPQYDKLKVKELVESYNLSENTAKILYSRNITDHESILNYLVGDYDEGFDPFLMNDMEKAVDRINKAIENEEKILVYGDYDADGITSTVLMLETLSSLGAHVTSYIPNRFNEGYGPNKEAFSNIIDSGVSLIITVDNGIAAVDEIEFAKSKSCDVILTDHHQIQDKIPNAYAVVHPEHPNATYPFGQLAGVGVAFKLAHALLGIYPDFLLDLVAIGTVADMVPMISENRIFVKQGLKLLNEDTRLGIKYVLEKSNHTTQIDEQTIGFTIAPRLNSIGRMTSAKEGIMLLSVDDNESVVNLVEKVESYNIERKAVTDRISKDADVKVQNKINNSILLVSDENYHEGVLGIVASNLVEKYKRPVLVSKIEGDRIKGSARSYGNFNIYEAMNKIGEKFTAFGGHHSAAGFSAEIQNAEEIEIELGKLYDQYLLTAEEKLKKEIDLIVNFDDISHQLLQDLNNLKPFGNSFENISILSENVVVSKKENFGSDKQYLKLLLTSTENNIEAISFKDNLEFNKVKEGDIIDVMFTLSVNYFTGRPKLQLQLIDFDIKDLLFKDFRGLVRDFNNLPREELKISKKYSDHDNNYFTYKELAMINKNYDIINILEAPTNIDNIKSLLKFNPKAIKIMCDSKSTLFSKYKIDKDRLIKLFNILLKYKTLRLEDKSVLTKLLSNLNTNLESFKIMLKILEELNLCSVKQSTITFNSNYDNVNLDVSSTYRIMQETFYIENLLVKEDIGIINKLVLENTNEN